jgi:tetratricopeptide (TPR) repeat protein
MIEGPRLLAEAIETFGDNLIVTHYEDVVADTQAEVRRLCEFLELPFFEPMLEYGARPAPIGECGDPQKVNAHNAPVEDYVETWKGLLSLDDFRRYATRYLDIIGDKVLSRLGYSLTTLSLQLEACPLSAASESLEIEAGSSASLVSAGEVAYLAGDIKKAEANFMDAYAMDSTDIVACNNLVVLYWESGDAEQALRYLGKAMQLDSTNREVVVNGGQILCAYGYKAEAVRLYEGYLIIRQDDKEVLALYEQAVSGVDNDTLADIARQDSEQVAANYTDDVERVDFSLPKNTPITMIADEAVLSWNSEQEDKETEVTTGGSGEILVTAIVSTYNSEKYIEGCLQDLLSQTIANRLEVIVVDSGSQQNERAFDISGRMNGKRFIPPGTGLFAKRAGSLSATQILMTVTPAMPMKKWLRLSRANRILRWFMQTHLSRPQLMQPLRVLL